MSNEELCEIYTPEKNNKQKVDSVIILSKEHNIKLWLLRILFIGMIIIASLQLFESTDTDMYIILGLVLVVLCFLVIILPKPKNLFKFYSNSYPIEGYRNKNITDFVVNKEEKCASKITDGWSDILLFLPLIFSLILKILSLSINFRTKPPTLYYGIDFGCLCLCLVSTIRGK